MNPAELDVWSYIAHDRAKQSLAVAVLDSEPPLRLVEGSTVNSHLEVPTQYVSLPGTPDADSLELNGPKAVEETDPAAQLVDKAGGTWAVVTTCSIDVQQYHFSLGPSEAATL